MQDTTIEALRAWAPLVASGYEVPAASKVMLAAADEIERLRELVSAMQQRIDGTAVVTKSFPQSREPIDVREFVRRIDEKTRT